MRSHDPRFSLRQVIIVVGADDQWYERMGDRKLSYRDRISVLIDSPIIANYY